MKHISIIIYEDVLPTAVANTTALLTSANEAAAGKGRPLPFDIELVSAGDKQVQSGMLVQLCCSKTISDHFDTDVVIIPPMNTTSVTVDALLSRNNQLISWIQEQYASHAQVISLCTGAYILAACGLLDGMPATSHWGALEDLQKRYPLINFQADKVITHSKGILTGGGGFSSLNTLLYFIEGHCGKEIAVELSKFYALDYSRTSQQIFSVFSGQRSHDDEEIHEAQSYIEAHFKVDLSVEEVARHVNMSKRNFIRRFKNATSSNPITFIQRIKVEAAKRALEEGETNIAAVTYDVGYNDLRTFRTVFKRITGLTPVEYRNSYNIKRDKYTDFRQDQPFV
ncbi:helix-turn-helix domain-containing protein [Chitinophaga pendula]|uniref:GlxA family transcriptional regulator n=1 Tax=Chitinophaga TaxID=79328 RepID=UPI000BB0C7A6|nr:MULTISPECIES: helix-turn-helix domain-containing protein [Chitinophaga]ASZ13300.1 AraC family transcriptional regulator [Chitinophaga sp. MD30]UCJ09076.1 helix-turn-helix domain-containing protein [Chitinophaga pendula]